MSADMGFIDWIKQRKERAGVDALASKYGHDAIGAPGAAGRHYQKLLEAKDAKTSKPEKAATKARPQPSWER